MTTQLRELIKRLMPVALTQIVGLACGVVGVKLVSQFVPPALLGNYGVFLTFTTLGMWVVHAGLIKFVLRHWAAAEHKPAMLLAVLASWRRKLPLLIISGVIAVFAIGRLTGQSSWLVGVILLATITLLSLVSLAQAALQAAQEHWRDCAVSTVGSLGRTFAPLLVYLGMGGAAAGLYLGFGLHTLLFTATGVWMLRRYLKRRRDTAPVLPAVQDVYTGHLFTMLSLASWALSGVNRWIMAWSFGSMEAGYFVLASNIALIIPNVLGAISIQLFQPGFFRLGDADAQRALGRRIDGVAAGFCLLALPAIVALRGVMPWLVGPLINATYLDALNWIVPVGFFGIAIITGQYYHSMLLAARREHRCAHVDLTTAALLILGSVLAAMGGQTVFSRWLMLSPLVPWLATRTLARHYAFKAA